MAVMGVHCYLSCCMEFYGTVIIVPTVSGSLAARHGVGRLKLSRPNKACSRTLRLCWVRVCCAFQSNLEAGLLKLRVRILEMVPVCYAAAT
eukprot:scaffold192170_cov18-Tisochrysis_lutea.AAC.1